MASCAGAWLHVGGAWECAWRRMVARLAAELDGDGLRRDLNTLAGAVSLTKVVLLLDLTEIQKVDFRDEKADFRDAEG